MEKIIYRKRPTHRRRRNAGVGAIIGRVILVFFTVLIAVAATLFISLKMICGSTSPAAKVTFVTTILETGKLQPLAKLLVPSDEIQEIVKNNTMASLDSDVDSSLISIKDNNGSSNSSDNTNSSNNTNPSDKTEPIEIKEISGRTFYGTLMIVKDPSKVSLASIYPWRETGVTLDALVNDSGSVAGINGGLYNSGNNSGGRPYGIVVKDGEIQLNDPQSFAGLVLIGFDSNNVLQIVDVDGMTPSQTESLIHDMNIRDAVTFQEEASDKNNHFVKLVINGVARELNGAGSGLNPRTCIGQRADGAVLMLVTDGRGKSGHLGASASDLISVMEEYGAVNAANLDGGSSSCMYYGGEYLMTSVTFYYSNNSWRMPVAFVVKE